MKRKLLLAAFLTLGSLFLGACAAHAGYYVATPPPSPRAVGVFGVAPGPGYVWTDGYWAWRPNAYYWVPGRWVRPPRPRAVWAPGYWNRHPRGYVWVPGRWRR